MDHKTFDRLHQLSRLCEVAQMCIDLRQLLNMIRFGTYNEQMKGDLEELAVMYGERIAQHLEDIFPKRRVMSIDELIDELKEIFGQQNKGATNNDQA